MTDTKISEACERCGRCRQGDFANCKNARNLVEASRDALPFVAYAYSQGIEGAEEAGRAIEAALAVRQPGTNAPDVEAVLADRIRRLSRYTHVGWRDPFTGVIKSDMVLAPDGEWVRLGYVRNLLDGRDAGTGVGNG